MPFLRRDDGLGDVLDRGRPDGVLASISESFLTLRPLLRHGAAAERLEPPTEVLGWL